VMPAAAGQAPHLPVTQLRLRDISDTKFTVSLIFCFIFLICWSKRQLNQTFRLIGWRRSMQLITLDSSSERGNPLFFQSRTELDIIHSIQLTQHVSWNTEYRIVSSDASIDLVTLINVQDAHQKLFSNLGLTLSTFSDLPCSVKIVAANNWGAQSLEMCVADQSLALQVLLQLGFCFILFVTKRKSISRQFVVVF
jgi:hypothetical protein